MRSYKVERISSLLYYHYQFLLSSVIFYSDFISLNLYFRSTKRTPVQRTPLSASAHTHPVHAVMIAGSLNAHNLLSISSDGKLCTWSLDMLGQPQQAMELTHRQARTVAATCMSFVDENVNNFLVGSEDGRAYAGSRHGK